MAVLPQATGIVANDVVAKPSGAPQPGRNRDIVFRRELYRFTASRDWYPDRRMRLLHWSRPYGDILVGPELSRVGEDLLTPSAHHDFEGLLEACARLGQRHMVHLVFARNAARKARDEPPI